jgi:site-specific DNA recombinase
MQVAIYVRVSTQYQAQQQTIEQQLERLRVYIQTKNWDVADQHIFRDDGYSGATLNRPGLDRLRDLAASAAFDRVLLTSPDRLARKYVHQVLLIEELEQKDCQVEFLDRPMTQDPHDQLLLQIRGAVAEYERTLITERMRRGRLSKFRAGVLLPWTRPPYGYRLHPERPRDPQGVRIEPAEAAIVAEIYAQYLQDGAGLIKVAKYLAAQGIPSPTGKKRWGLATLRGMLTNPAYTGRVYAGRTHSRPAKIRRSATHPMGHPHGSLVPTPRQEWILVAEIPAIVQQEQFDLVQAKLAGNQSFASRHNVAHQYLLRALVSCGICQLACFGRTAPHGQYSYYICSGKAKPVQNRRDEKCPSRFVPARQLDEFVWQDLCDLITHPQAIAHAMERALHGHWLPQELQARQENLRRGRVSLEQQIDRLTEAYLGGVIPLAEYQRRRHELEQRSLALENQTRQLLGQIQRQNELAGLASKVEDFCQRIQTALSTATFEQKRQLVELLVDRVVITDGDVEIRYAIPTSQNSEHVRFCHLRTDYFGNPYLVGMGHQQPLNQIGITREVVRTVGRAPFAHRSLPLYAQMCHQAAHMFAVDLPTLAPQLGSQSPIPVGGPFLSQAQQCLRQCRLVLTLAAIVVAAARQVQGLAKHSDGILLGQGHAQLPFLRRGAPQMLEAFFSTSISSACRPTKRSSSAMRASSRLQRSSPWNTTAERSRKVAFQVESKGAPMPYWRQTSALLLCPLRTSRTTLALNSAVNVRRSDMVSSSLDIGYRSYPRCPVRGAHFNGSFPLGHSPQKLFCT